jgi:hypothetical protein
MSFFSSIVDPDMPPSLLMVMDEAIMYVEKENNEKESY